MTRVGLIGYGYWGPNLARNIASTPGLSLESIADTNPERLAKARVHHPGAFLASTPGMLIDYDLDAVVIATPVASHFELAYDALRAGLHVLVEKPMTSSYIDACALRESAETYRRILMVDHTFVYTGAVRKMHELLNHGLLGRPLFFDSTRVNLGLFQPDVDVMWDLATHDLSILHRLLRGRLPASVIARGHDPLRHGKATSAQLALDYEDGFRATIGVSWLSPVKIRRIVLGCSREMVVYDDIEPTEKVKVYDMGVNIDDQTRLVDYRTGDVRMPKLAFDEALSVELAHFATAIDCFASGLEHPLLVDADAGVAVVRILEAASLSARNDGQRVVL